jgi:UDP:flavonoid glycosyltransferase YjiC (YdhE family)
LASIRTQLGAHGLRDFRVFAERVLLVDAKPRFRVIHRALAGADLVVCHWMDYLGQEAAIARGLRWLTGIYLPEAIPTGLVPPHGYPRLGPVHAEKMWAATWAIVEPFNAAVSELLATLHPRRARSKSGPARRLALAGAFSPHLNLVMTSRHLTEAQPDWPATFRVTGPWYLDAPADFAPDPALAAFLAEHDRPVVVSFGSMSGTERGATSELVARALELAGRPAIVQGSQLGLQIAEAAGRLSIGHVPHDFLFARAGCVVHHGGVGTSAATVRAGVPSVVVPHYFDQYYWGAILEQRGVATKPLFRFELDPAKLAERIVFATSDPQIQRRARDLGAEVRREDGVGVAVGAIEQEMERTMEPTMEPTHP